MPENFEKVVRRLTLRPIFVLLLLGLALVALIQYLLASANLVEHADRVVAQAYVIEADLVDMETGLRGFQLTKESAFLEPYNWGREKIPADGQKLADLVQDNSVQTEVVRELRARTQEWLEFAKTMLSRRNAGHDFADTSENLRGKQLMDTARAGIKQLVTSEHSLRLRRVAAVDRLRTILFTVIALTVVVLGPAAVLWIRRLLRRATENYRTMAEQARRQAEELRVTLRSIGDAVIATDAEGLVTFLNPVAETLTGWTTAEASGNPLIQVFPISNEQTGQVAEDPVARVLKERKVVGLANHTVLRSRDGRLIPIEDSAAPILDADNEIRGVILVFHDVSETRAAERARRESEDYLRLLLDSTEEGFYGVDRYGAMTICNAACLRLLGYDKAEELIGVKLHEVIHHTRPDGSPYDKEQCPINRTARSGEPSHVEDELFFRKDGSSFPVEYWSYPVLHNGELEGAVTSFIDISARKKAEALVQEGAERFQFLAESMPQKIFTAKPTGEVDYFNRQWLEFTGFTFEQMRDWGWIQLVHPEDVEENLRLWHHSMETGEPFYMEHRFLRLDGQFRWHVSRAVPMRDSKGKTVMWIGSNTDIEDIRQAQEKAERASQAKDDFLAALSHELRTPLTPVLMTAAMLREEERLPEDVREQLAMMQRNIELEARLIDDLLDLTRIVNGKLQLRAQRCDAHSLVALAVEMVRSEASRKHQILEVDLAAQRSLLNCDPARMQQVFWNLLKNAVKFTPESGRLVVRSRDLGDGLAIEISDTGVGIPSEAIARIFLPFEQVTQNAHDHRAGGLGLGLSISKAILDLHGGRIEVESAGLGQGATFRVELPSMESDPEALVDGAPAADTPSRRNVIKPEPLRLLLVEDHEPTLTVLERLLTRAGHSVTAASTVEAALQLASKEFDAVISDVGLPDGTGFQLMQELKEKYQLPGIALSGYGMDEDIRRSKEAGFHAHLTKPVDFSQLEQALANLVAEHLDA